MSVCLSVYHTIQYGRIVTQLYTDIPKLSRYITGMGLLNVSHQIFGKLIIVANSGTSWRFFDIMTNFLKSRWIVWRHDAFLTSWHTFWQHDVFLTSWQTFGVFLMPWIVFTWWRLFDKPFEVMTSTLSSWRVFTSWRIFWWQGEHSDVLTYFWRTFWHHDMFWRSWRHGRFWHDILLDAMNFLTSWCVLYVMIRFWCHWRHNIFLLYDNFWLHDKLLTSWQTFDVSWWIFWSWRTFCHHNMCLTPWRTFLS